MDEVKHWLTSKTVIAAAIGVALSVAQVFGLTDAVGIDKDSIADNVVKISEGALYMIALIGRLTASKKLVA